MVVRLVTPPTLLDARLRGRDAARLLEDHLAIMPALRRSMDESRLEDFRVVNDERSPREVATEVLEQIGWFLRGRARRPAWLLLPLLYAVEASGGASHLVGLGVRTILGEVLRDG
jgi:hypothetical protein